MENKIFKTAIIAVICTIVQVKIVTGSALKVKSCDNYKCDPGQECYMKVSDCGRYCCPQTPACRPSCDVIRCKGACVDGACVDEPVDKCALVLCQEGTYCEDGVCKSLCEKVDCGPGRECYLQPANCTSESCPPPVPACRPSCDVIRCRGACVNGACVDAPESDQCAAVRCKSGYYCDLGQCYKTPSCEGYTCPSKQKCLLEKVVCFRAPCPPLPTCVPA